MKKPIAGVLPLWDEEKKSVWMLPDYLNALIQAGAVPVILPLTEDRQSLERAAEICDGFLFTGGQDVSPRLYGEEPMEQLVSTCEKRDAAEAILLKAALAADKPVLGVCRGLQFINVMLGGSLYQDLPLQHPSDINHHGHAPYDQPVHDVGILRDSPLYDCLKVQALAVNSLHHQGIKRKADGLEVMAAAPDGIAEAVCKPDQRFLWAVQWHPEYSYQTDINSRKIFSEFVKAMN